MADDAYKRGYDRIVWKPIIHDTRPAEPSRRAAFPCPMVIGDTMPPTEHVDGKLYESKSAFRRVTKENGLIEVGNDPARLKKIEKPKPDRAQIKEAVAKAVSQVLS